MICKKEIEFLLSLCYDFNISLKKIKLFFKPKVKS